MNKKRKGRSRTLIVVAGVVLLVAVLLLAAWMARTGPREDLSGTAVPPSTFSALNGVATAPYGKANSSFTSHFASLRMSTYYYSSGKPVVLFIGAEGCGPCAGLRWPVILALLRFGNFSGLRLMVSSPSDVYPNVPTFSFERSVYLSNYVEFQGFEIADRSGGPLDNVPSNYTADWRTNNSTVPYLTFANAYLVLGTFSPLSMEGMNWTQVISLVQSGKGAGLVIKQLTNDMTAVVCAVDGHRPADVCSQPAISGFLLIGESVGKTGIGAPFSAESQTPYAQGWWRDGGRASLVGWGPSQHGHSRAND